jgi:hypothetical protein
MLESRAIIYNSNTGEAELMKILRLTIDLIPTSIREFADVKGPFHVTVLLKTLIGRKKDIKPDRIDLLRVHHGLLESCLLLLTTLSERGPIFKQMLGSYSIFSYLMQILSEKNQPVKIMCKCLIICSSLCYGYKLNRELFGIANGVNTVVDLL